MSHQLTTDPPMQSPRIILPRVDVRAYGLSINKKAIKPKSSTARGQGTVIDAGIAYPRATRFRRPRAPITNMVNFARRTGVNKRVKKCTLELKVAPTDRITVKIAGETPTQISMNGCSSIKINYQKTI